MAHGLDLEHLRAPLGEQAGRFRRGDSASDFKDPDPAERQPAARSTTARRGSGGPLRHAGRSGGDDRRARPAVGDQCAGHRSLSTAVGDALERRPGHGVLVVEHLRGGQYGSDPHPGRVALGGDLLAGRRGEAGRETGDDLRPLLRTEDRCLPLRTGPLPRGTEPADQAPPVPRGHRQDEAGETVAAGEQRVRTRTGACWRQVEQAPQGKTHLRALGQGEHRRDVDHLPHPVVAPAPQAEQGGERAERRADVLAVRPGRRARGQFGHAGPVDDAGEALSDELGRCPGGRVAGQPERGEGDHDEVGMAIEDGLGSGEIGGLCRTRGAERSARDEGDVRPGEQAVASGVTGGELDDRLADVAVQVVEARTVRGERGAVQSLPSRGFDAHDLGAEVGEHAGGERPVVAGEVDDAHAVEKCWGTGRVAHRRHRGRCTFLAAHRAARRACGRTRGVSAPRRGSPAGRATPDRDGTARSSPRRSSPRTSARRPRQA